MHLIVSTFPTDCTDKEQAVKLLEEASEAREAWQQMDAARRMVPLVDAPPEVDAYADALADELADCITACANLAAREGLDMQAAIIRVERRNRERGRYDHQ